MRAPSQAFFIDIKKNDGNYLRGQIGISLQDYNVRTFILPRRFLLVDIDCQVEPGDIILSGLRKYLLIDHSERSKDRTRMFRLAEITRNVEWKQQTTNVDLVTGLPRETDLISNGNIDVCWEFSEAQYDADNKKNSRIRVLCGVDLKNGDLLDDHVVHFTETMHGITYAELS